MFELFARLQGLPPDSSPTVASAYVWDYLSGLPNIKDGMDQDEYNEACANFADRQCDKLGRDLNDVWDGRSDIRWLIAAWCLDRGFFEGDRT